MNDEELDSRPLAEAMGLRLEATTRLRPIDAAIVVALVLSGLAWLWVSLAGVPPRVVDLLASRPGRLLAAAVGLACVGAVFRAYLVSRWPTSENDRSLV
jgi:hypothetical protein